MKKRVYREDVNKRLDIIKARLRPDDEDRVLNLETPELQAEVLKLASDRGIFRDGKPWYALWEALLVRLEKQLEKTLQLVIVQVAPPSPSSFPIKGAGAPFCYVARDLGIVGIWEAAN